MDLLEFRRWCESYAGSPRAVGALFFLLVVNRWKARGFPKLFCLGSLRSNLPVSLCLAKDVVA